MSGVAFEVKEQGLTEALLKIEGIANAPTEELAEGIGRLVQESTRNRIRSTKTSPAGAAWKANRAGTAILYRSGALERSIDYVASADSVVVGSGLVYARIHQMGGTIPARKIEPRSAKALAFKVGGRLVFAKSVNMPSVTMPARPYLGLSPDDLTKIILATESWLSELVQ
ncbi:phage virion morphogenesis protein [Rhizobium sp. YJ-22]|uniref:phage virion morphogenesis protein n=1 Tax=Rhizobium sp. YJ-22 TaxID=3037556 RepID=UPI0024127E78|nr:phage virion morphogenesis protein [Rhizobium sp. YJ-22]MDG3575979.1 phage virion morphogenesis protein [Rhizobium sp. YJ-22]